MPGGFPFNFNIDPAQMMRMLQSTGPVNMEVARMTAEGAATTDAETQQAIPDPPPATDATSAFEGVVRAAQTAVADAVGIPAALTVSYECVNRVQWSHATLAGLEPVLVALAGALTRTPPDIETDDATAAQFGLSQEALMAMLSQQLMPMVLGAWSGMMIGTLSHNALGQYDLPLPLTGEANMRFVLANADAFASEWELPGDELRYSVALREIVRASQRSIPWVRDRLVRLASAYVGAYEVNPNAFEGFAKLDPNDPSSMAAIEQFADPDAILSAMKSERQGPLLEELQRFVAVLEGYTDLVVARLGERMVASHVRIDEALRRHRLDRGEAGVFVDRLLGLELDRDHYEAGVAFARGVVERSDDTLDQLNRLWDREEMVPTPNELQAPGLWLARIDLPAS
jgi:putative hydrolase